MTVEAAGVMVVGADNAYDSDGAGHELEHQGAEEILRCVRLVGGRHRIGHAEEEQMKEQAKGNNWENLEITEPVFRRKKYSGCGAWRRI